jgi:hypothetical protein
MASVRMRPEPPPANRTLGWAVADWMVDNLVHGVTGDPLEISGEMLDFLLLFYQVDENGRWAYDRAALRRARGTGKSPIGADIACAELCGPVRFGGWDDDGMPIAVPEPAPWVQIIATSMAQTDPVMKIVLASFSKEAIDKYGLAIGVEAVVKSFSVDGGGPGRLQAIPNNPRSLRGSRPTAVIADEVSEWVSSNGGHEAMVRIRSNLAKNPGGRARLIELCNAFVPGEDSHAERTHRAYVEQVDRFGRSRILYDNLEADPALRLNVDSELRTALTQAAGDAHWLDIGSLAALMLDGSVSVSVFRREHLNQLLSAEDSLISAQLYDELSQDVRPLSKTDKITLGFDGALSGDGTALVAFRLEDRSFHVAFYEEPDPLVENWRIDEEAVDEVVQAYLGNYAVQAAACDVHPFESWVNLWERTYGSQMKVRMSPAGMLVRDNRSDLRKLTFLTEALVNEVESRKIRFAPSGQGRQHWANAKRRLNRHGFSFGKITKSSTKRVDIVAASLMAYAAASALDSNFKTDKTTPARRIQLKP